MCVTIHSGTPGLTVLVTGGQDKRKSPGQPNESCGGQAQRAVGAKKRVEQGRLFREGEI